MKRERDARERPKALAHIRRACLSAGCVTREELDELLDAPGHDLLVAFECGASERAGPRPPPPCMLMHVHEARQLLRAVRHVAPCPVCADGRGLRVSGGTEEEGRSLG